MNIPEQTLCRDIAASDFTTEPEVQVLLKFDWHWYQGELTLDGSA